MTILNLNSLLEGLEKEAQIEKTASTREEVKPAISQELAGILEKKASQDMTKKAYSEGEALARELLAQLQKQADDFAASPAQNEIITGNSDMVADDDKKVVPNPSGSVEQVLQGVVNNATASGATTDDRVNHETQVNNVAPAGDPVEGVKQAQVANATTETKEDNTMNKTASDSQLAKQIMEKLAQEFSSEVTTPAAGVNTTATSAPNKIIRDNAVMTAQDDAKVQGVVPGGDGTINALYETIVATARAQGGQSDDLINGAPNVSQRSDSPIMTGGAGPVSEGQEKAAAVSALCDAGMDFETAVSLVKQAEDELLSEAWEQEKRACFDQLVAEGVNFDQAIELIKQAEEDLIKQAEADGQ